MDSPNSPSTTGHFENSAEDDEALERKWVDFRKRGLSQELKDSALACAGAMT
jgi:hypothetical protein